MNRRCNFSPTRCAPCVPWRRRSRNPARGLRLPLRWIALLHGRLDCSLAGTSGVHSSLDALKLIAAGADVAMSASALLRHGPGHLADLLGGMAAWLDEHEYVSVSQLRGSMSQASCPDPAAFERAGYMQALVSYTPRQG